MGPIRRHTKTWIQHDTQDDAHVDSWLDRERSERTVSVDWAEEDDLVSVARFIADCFDHFQSGGDPS
jgi:hypothetical protein